MKHVGFYSVRNRIGRARHDLHGISYPIAGKLDEPRISKAFPAAFGHAALGKLGPVQRILIRCAEGVQANRQILILKPGKRVEGISGHHRSDALHIFYRLHVVFVEPNTGQQPDIHEIEPVKIIRGRNPHIRPRRPKSREESHAQCGDYKNRKKTGHCGAHLPQAVF